MLRKTFNFLQSCCFTLIGLTFLLVWWLKELFIGFWRGLLRSVPRTTIVVDGKDYLTRYFIEDHKYLGWPLRKLGRKMWLHHFHASDPGTDLHNHPWAGWSLILKGGYIERFCRVTDTWLEPINDYCSMVHHCYSAPEVRVLRPLSINRLHEDVYHHVILLGDDCWTLFFAKERYREWEFLNTETWETTPWQNVKGAVP